MKKLIYLFLVMVSLVACHKDNKNNNDETSPCCGEPFEDFTFYADKKYEDFLANATLHKIAKTGEILDTKIGKGYGKSFYKPIRNTNYIGYSFSVINDIKRKLGKREEFYRLETPDQVINITIKGEFLSNKRCCAVPEIQEVLLNGKKWEQKNDTSLDKWEDLVENKNPIKRTYYILEGDNILKKNANSKK
jgi:hypothetical protein